MGRKKNEVADSQFNSKNQLKEGANTEGIMLLLDSMNWEPVDLNDPVAVRQRIIDYFNLMAKHDTKPLVNAYAHALGIDRKRLWELVNNIPNILQGNPKDPRYVSCDKMNKESLSIIQEGYSLLSESWEYNFANGKYIHPAVGIFLGKNHFGYVDQQEMVVTPKNQLGETSSTEEIEKRYMESIAE